jgi:hypothetical protein
MNREELFAVIVPEETDSYSPVSHESIITNVDKELKRKGIVITSETYNVGRFGEQLIGNMNIQYKEHTDLGMRLAFRNSYDKSMSVAFVAGTHVWICGNGMIGGEIQFLRRHTGNVVHELREKIALTAEQLEEHFHKMLRHSKRMQEIQMSKRIISELSGRLFIEHELITATQLGVIKREIIAPTFDEFKDENLWSFYNYVTYSLKTAHPTKFIEQHKDFHEFVEQEFNLI